MELENLAEDERPLAMPVPTLFEEWYKYRITHFDEVAEMQWGDDGPVIEPDEN